MASDASALTAVPSSELIPSQENAASYANEQAAAGDVQMSEALPYGTETHPTPVAAQDVGQSLESPAGAYAVQGAGGGQEFPNSSTDAEAKLAQPISADNPAGEVKAEPVPLTEDERLWNIVNINPADFSTWTSLILETEKLDDISKIRAVYDKFLAEFPLCYGYWKKYADHEARHGNVEKTVEVYERSVAAVAYSVDMWTHYCVFTMGKTTDLEEIRSLFERGLSYVGTDYLAHVLWDKYLEFELANEEWSKVAQLYTRILAIPMQHLDRYYTHFKSFVYTRPLIELWTPQETAAAALADAAAKEAEKRASENQGEDKETSEGDKVEGEEGGKEEAEGENQGENKEEEKEAQAESIKHVKTDAEKLEEYLTVREALYRASKERDAKIKEYESLIKRPYFHVKVLDEMQLANWHRYLDFIEREGDFGRVVKLYERCVIPCANYPEYWIRYVERMVMDNSMERALDALTRATTIFVKRRPEIHLFAAKFHEQLGDFSSARSSFELISSEIAPGLLEAAFKFANFERRQGNLDASSAIFESSIQVEKSKEDSKSLPHLYIQYARFTDQVMNDTDKAREILTQAVEKVLTSKSLWLAFILFEASHAGEDRSARIKKVLDQALAATKSDGTPSLTSLEREDLSLAASELVDVFGDMETLKQIEFYHRQEFPLRRFTPDVRKRSAMDMYTDRAAKQHKVQGAYASVAPSTASYAQAPAAGAASSAQTPWAGYSSQAYTQQTWPAQTTRTSAAPAQQAWSSVAYSQQAPYSGYSAYPAAASASAQAPTAYSAYPTATAAPTAQTPAYSVYGQAYAGSQAYQTSSQVGYAQTGTQVPAATPASAQPYYQQGYYAQ